MGRAAGKQAKPKKGLSRRTVLGSLAGLPLTTGAGLKSAPAAAGSAAVQPVGRPHVAVVGAGAFGGWTALHLLRRGARVTLLDTWGPGNSRASSGGETRVIRSLYGPDRIYVELVRRSHQLWREAAGRWGTPLYRRTGAVWMMGEDDSYASASLPIVRELGFEVESLAPAAAAARYPQIDFRGVRSVFVEKEAGSLPARRACGLVVENFIAEGGSYRQVAVRPGARRDGTLEGLRLADGGRLSADAYVFACGPWLGQIFPAVVGSRIQATRQEIYYFGPPADDRRFGEGALPVWVDFTDGIHYGIPGNERRGFKVADDTRGAPFDPTTGDRTPSPEGIEAVRQFLGRRFPAMAGAPLVEARVCQYENSPDGHFIVDRHPEADNAWIVGGGSGHGFKLCPALGEFVAERVLGEKPVEPFFGLARLQNAGTARTQFE